MPLNDIVWEGWIQKRGAQVKNWKKRWFTLTAKGMLRYYKANTRDETPLGEIDLEKTFECIIDGDKCDVDWPKCIDPKASAFGLAVTGRVYYFASMSVDDIQRLIGFLRRHDKTPVLSRGPDNRPRASLPSKGRSPSRSPAELPPQPSEPKQKEQTERVPGEVYYESWDARKEGNQQEKKKEPEMPVYASPHKNKKGPRKDLPPPRPTGKKPGENAGADEPEQPEYANINVKRRQQPRPPSQHHAPGEVIYDPLVRDDENNEQSSEMPQYAVSEKLKNKRRQQKQPPPTPPPEPAEKTLPMYENVEIGGFR